jgi:hypothetical protein
MKPITPQTTIQELESTLKDIGAKTVSVAYSHRFCSTWLVLHNRNLSGTGPDLITALNDALGKAGQ